MGVEKRSIKRSFKVCPKCGYRDGFHIMLEKSGKSSYRINLICPNCSQVFDIGFSTTLKENL
ncbi:MAG: hypothetical protein HZA77_11350 [Candidatus Schekmanbacteria bacterium]|nr:hypothetical protein [Candidatus Schekmanbacteria bacterium]